MRGQVRHGCQKKPSLPLSSVWAAGQSPDKAWRASQHLGEQPHSPDHCISKRAARSFSKRWTFRQDGLGDGVFSMGPLQR